MKFYTTLSVLASFTLGLSACAESRNATRLDPNDQKETATINGESAEEYFNHFIAATSGSCDKSIYFWRINTEDVLIGKHDSGLDIRASASIFMHHDQTYTAEYSESVVREYNGGGWSGYVLNKETMSGRWTIEGDQLVFSNFAVASGVVINGVRDLHITFSNNVVSAGLQNTSATGYYNWGTAGEVSQNEFCSRL